MKAVFAAAALFLSLAAHAENVKSTCTDAKKQTVLEMNASFDGTYDALEGEQAMSGTITMSKLRGQAVNTNTVVSGITGLSAQGPYVDLDGGRDLALHIAAPAADDTSSITISGKQIILICD